MTGQKYLKEDTVLFKDTVLNFVTDHGKFILGP